ncbi:hypothetical protein AA21952_2490 [Acetobacter oeni LMG 21952]|nr:hypothetical protein AA21952_2490 [Acetobacter oeni LMG 21952]
MADTIWYTGAHLLPASGGFQNRIIRAQDAIANVTMLAAVPRYSVGISDRTSLKIVSEFIRLPKEKPPRRAAVKTTSDYAIARNTKDLTPTVQTSTYPSLLK